MSHTTLPRLTQTANNGISVGMEKVFTVYIATHKTRGCYVGCTSMSLQQRKYFHRKAAQKARTPFHKAIQISPRGWVWSVLFLTTNEAEAFSREEAEILARPDSLNVKVGYRNKEGVPYGGHKNKGRRMSESTRAWFREFHSTRPRKRKFDRAEMVRLFNEGKTTSEISKTLGCDQALVSRVVNGIYPQN